MRALNLFTHLFALFTVNRQTGHTSLLKKLCEEGNTVFILFPDKETGIKAGIPPDNIMTFEDLKTGRFDGLKTPVLIDNYTMKQISEIGNAAIISQSKQIKEQEDLIDGIRDLVYKSGRREKDLKTENFRRRFPLDY